MLQVKIRFSLEEGINLKKTIMGMIYFYIFMT
jgi:hypothetical protein